MQSLRWFAVVAPGLEEVAARELRALSQNADSAAIADLRVETGGLEWTAPPIDGYRANLWLRLGHVLARVGTVEAREFGKLRRRAAGLDWPAFIAPGAAFDLRASASRSPVPHRRHHRDGGAGDR